MNADNLIVKLKQIQLGILPAESIIEDADPLIELLELLTIERISVPPAGENSVFIAGDISGHMDVLLRRNLDAENLLKRHGHKVLNPLTIIPEKTSWQPAMRICLQALIKNCSSIALYPDWNKSRDAQVQFLLASQLGYNVIRL